MYINNRLTVTYLRNVQRQTVHAYSGWEQVQHSAKFERKDMDVKEHERLAI